MCGDQFRLGFACFALQYFYVVINLQLVLSPLLPLRKCRVHLRT